jgi:hypothetical protein
MNYYKKVITHAKEKESGTKFTNGWKTTALRTAISGMTQKHDNRNYRKQNGQNSLLLNFLTFTFMRGKREE